MNTKTRFTILIGIIVLLAVLTIYTQHRVKEVNDSALGYKTALENKDLETYSKDKMLREKDEEIAVLKLQNKRLKDSIEILQQEVGRLNSVLGKQGQELLVNKKKMEEMRIREDSLVKEIGRMLAERSSNSSKIDNLQAERLSVNKNMAELYERNDYLKDSIVNATIEKEAAKEKLTIQEQIYEISNNTVVKFNTVRPKKDNGNAARNPKRWKLTEIDLELFHPKGDILMDEIFLVTLRDLDKNIPIPPREANPGKDTQGVTFSFTGNPVKTIRYPNYQAKESDNYALQVFYIKNGKKYALNKGGVQRIAFRK
ncbi:MAG: hypothetical protein AB8G11_24700 [Saprospiraceae bacterium]